MGLLSYLFATAEVTVATPPEIKTPWYLEPWNLFNIIEVPMIFILILGLLLVAGIVYFILSGYLKEVKRQKAKAAKKAKKA